MWRLRRKRPPVSLGGSEVCVNVRAMRKIALSLLAHPDDAEILCAGTLIRLQQLGWEIHIVTVCKGDLGTAMLSKGEIEVIRFEECRRSVAVIGAQHHSLGEPDGYVMFDKSTMRKTCDLFRTINPGLVFAHPIRDYMLDHEQVSLLARAATFLYAAKNATDTPVPAGASVPWLYYCDPIGGVDPYGATVTPTTIIDITATQDKKLQMLGCHASQREWLAAHHGMDEYIESTRRHDADRGKLIGKSAAEAFVQHRGHAYPDNDVLKELLGK